MSTKSSKKSPVASLRKSEQYFKVERGQAGTVYVAWHEPSSNPAEFNLNFIDDAIAPASCNGQVVGYHVGHDHGFGNRHRHHYTISPKADSLDETHVWDKCAALFIDETRVELLTHYGRTPSYVSVATLTEIMA